MKTIIFDIDGTLADKTHRLHHIQKEPKDWDAFFEASGEDAVIKGVFMILMLHIHYAEHFKDTRVIFVTGRPEKYREYIFDWFFHIAHKMHIYLLDSFLSKQPDDPSLDCLYMRKNGDHRPDHIIKDEILKQLQAEGHDILCVFDDRKCCVDMWRRNGLLCFQVAEGDF